MMANEKELLEIERGFWMGGSDFFSANADRECLVAFPGMAQAMSNADLAETADNPKRWRKLGMRRPRPIDFSVAAAC